MAQSNYVVPPSEALTAFSAIGQFSDTVTPLQEAMFAAAIANNGTLMKPYLVQQVTASDLSAVQVTQPSVLSQRGLPVGGQFGGRDDARRRARPRRHRGRPSARRT